MIPNPFARPINVWITVLVLVLHGLTAWAMISIDGPERPEIKVIEPESIQLELVTLVTSPAKKPRTEPNFEPKSEPQVQPQPEEKAAEPVEKVKPVPVPVPVEQPELVIPLKPVESLKPEPKKEQLDPIKEKPKPQEKPKSQEGTETPVPLQESIKELEKIAKATTEEELDLSAIIRAVTEQYNRDQARQRQAAREQAYRKSAEQDRLQAQAEKKKAGKAEQRPLDKEATANDAPVNFSAEQASWLYEHEPNTSVPLQVWRSTTARSGDVFTVLLELHVDKNGYITEVQLLQSSGNQLIDAVATVQVRTGQFNPFQQDGMPVNGIVTMPLSYERP